MRTMAATQKQVARMTLNVAILILRIARSRGSRFEGTMSA